MASGTVSTISTLARSVSALEWHVLASYWKQMSGSACHFYILDEKKTCQLQLPFKMLLIVIVVKQITQDDIRKTYGGSSGSRGYFSGAFARSVVFHSSHRPWDQLATPSWPQGKNVYFLARWWVIAGGSCCTKNLHVIALVDHIVQKEAILRWFSSTTVYLHAICFTLWLAAATFRLVRECTFFPGVADFVIEDSLTSNASNTLTLENEWCLSCYSHLFLNVKPFIFPPFVFVILFLLK